MQLIDLLESIQAFCGPWAAGHETLGGADAAVLLDHLEKPGCVVPMIPAQAACTFEHVISEAIAKSLQVIQLSHSSPQLPLDCHALDWRKPTAGSVRLDSGLQSL